VATCWVRSCRPSIGSCPAALLGSGIQPAGILGGSEAGALGGAGEPERTQGWFFTPLGSSTAVRDDLGGPNENPVGVRVPDFMRWMPSWFARTSPSKAWPPPWMIDPGWLARSHSEARSRTERPWFAVSVERQRRSDTVRREPNISMNDGGSALGIGSSTTGCGESPPSPSMVTQPA
jgi:hypothetical protein